MPDCITTEQPDLIGCKWQCRLNTQTFRPAMQLKQTNSTEMKARCRKPILIKLCECIYANPMKFINANTTQKTVDVF